MEKLKVIGLCITVASFLAGSTSILAQSTASLDSEESQVSYSIGVNIGQNLLGQGLMDEIDLDLFIAGLRDIVAGQPRLSEEQMITALTAFQQKLMERQAAEMEAAQLANETFLTDNGARSGVTTTASGLQYEVLESGAADAVSPLISDSVLAHYHGSLIDGSVFDSSVERGQPAEFGLSQVIPGWTEALQLMKEGDKWRLFIPAELAYGPSGSGPIPPYSTLIFDVELLEVNPGAQ